MSDLVLGAVEDNSIQGCCLHKLQEVLVMFLRGAAIDANFVMYGNNARETVCYLAHVHLENILGHFQVKRHVQELAPAMMSIESGQVGRPFAFAGVKESLVDPGLQVLEFCVG